MAGISIRHLVKAYGDVTVIHDLSLDIRDKEFVVFVGPSGCGKSTLLRIIAGLEPISSGDIFIGDTRVNDIPASRRNIAMVFQDYALYPHMSVYGNMAFALELRRVSKAEIEARVRRAASLLHIEAFLDRKPKALSGGQRQRVAMGRAIVRDPSVFLFDEPLSNLDAKLRGKVRAEIKALSQQLQTTMIFVTHDQIEAMTMADRIVVLQDGFVQQNGTPEDIYERPVNQFVAGFIGSPAMNFFPVERRGGAIVFTGGHPVGRRHNAAPAVMAAGDERHLRRHALPGSCAGCGRSARSAARQRRCGASVTSTIQDAGSPPRRRTRSSRQRGGPRPGQSGRSGSGGCARQARHPPAGDGRVRLKTQPGGLAQVAGAADAAEREGDDPAGLGGELEAARGGEAEPTAKLTHHACQPGAGVVAVAQRVLHGGEHAGLCRPAST